MYTYILNQHNHFCLSISITPGMDLSLQSCSSPWALHRAGKTPQKEAVQMPPPIWEAKMF